MFKRITSMFLALCMILSMAMTVSFATEAETETAPDQPCTCTSHAENDGSGWLPLGKTLSENPLVHTSSGKAGAYYLLKAGNYYVEEDLVLPRIVYVLGENVNICLNGKTITLNVADTGMGLFNIVKGKLYSGTEIIHEYNSTTTFTICDHDPYKAGTICMADTVVKNSPSAIRTSSSYAVVNIQAGTISGFRGAGISMANGGTLNFNYGTITENGKGTGASTTGSTSRGGIWIATGTTNINGGTISKNSGPFGGGICVYNNINNKADATGASSGTATLNINGGTICDNEAVTSNGGGVYVLGKATVNGANNATANVNLNIKGGTITRNTSVTSGGGVYVHTTKTVASGATGKAAATAKFNMSNGTISFNKTGKTGGGVYLGAGTATMSGGIIDSNEVTGGSASADGGGGIYLMNNGTVLNMSGGKITNNTGYRGGAVYAYYFGIFNMSGGEIFGNSVKSNTHSCAVYLSNSRNVATLSGGNIIDNNCYGVVVAGKSSASFEGVTVTGNKTYDIYASNLYDNTSTEKPASLSHALYVSDGTIGHIRGDATSKDTQYFALNVTGGNIGKITTSIESPATSTITLSGGRFTTAPDAKYVADGYALGKDNQDTTYPYAVGTAYTATVADGIENGTVTVDPATTVAGATVTVTATPDEGYELSAIKVDDETISGSTFAMPDKNVTVTAEFAEKACAHTNKTAIGEYVAPTCSTTGMTAGEKCADCGEEITAQVEIPVDANAHPADKLVDVNPTAPTCEGTGLTAGKKCEACGVFTVPQTPVDALGHDWNEGVVTIEPTEDAEGEKTFTCKNDASHTKIEPVPVLVHEHDYESVVTKPTCTTEGFTTYTCKKNPEHTYVGNKVPALGHDYKAEVTTPATCTAPGVTTYTCANDAAHTYTEPIEQLPHTESVLDAVPATCEQPGLTAGVECSVCHEVLTAQTEIDPKGHDYKAVVTEPTCEQGGFTTYTCQNDATHTYTDNATEAKGHDWDEGVITTEPTYEAEGVRTFTCKNDASHTKTEAVGKLSLGYDELVAAIHAAGTEPTTIKLYQDITYSNGYYDGKTLKIEAGQNITLDLNGYTLGQTVVDRGMSAAAIAVRAGAELTVMDSSAAGTGKISASNTAIQLEGKLNLVSGTIAIDNPSPYDLDPETGFAYGVWFYMRSATAPAPEFYMTGGAIDISDAMLAAHTPAGCANAVAFNEGVDGVADYYDAAVVSITGDTVDGTVYVSEHAQNITVPEGVEVVRPVCKHTETEAVVEAKAATCTEPGTTAGVKCSACGTVITEPETIPVKDHRISSVNVNSATCEVDGWLDIGCGDCLQRWDSRVDQYAKDYLVKVPFYNLAAKGHDYEAVVTEPTCEQGGFTTYTCKNDATHTYTGNATEAKGHDWDEGVITTEPTEDAEGVKTFTCKNDANHTKTEPVAKLDHTHKYESKVTEPTCTEEGYTTYTCACGHSYVDDKVPAKGHRYSSVKVNSATCEEDGWLDVGCGDCGGQWDSRVDQIAKDYLANSPWYNVSAKGHDWDEGVITTEPTFDAPGVKTFTCKNDATHTYTEPVDQLKKDEPVNVEDFKAEGKVPVAEDGFFAGYYADADKTQAFTGATGSAYVKFVSKNVLSVKCQVTAGTTAASEKTDLRLLTTVDDLNYNKIGFKVTFGDKTVNVSSNKVFAKIVATTDGVAFEHAPSVFDKQSSYFMTYTITGIPAAEFGTTVTVVPYWITLDGTEQEGVSLTFTLNEVIAKN